jgi:protease-4
LPAQIEEQDVNDLGDGPRRNAEDDRPDSPMPEAEGPVPSQTGWLRNERPSGSQSRSGQTAAQAAPQTKRKPGPTPSPPPVRSAKGAGSATRACGLVALGCGGAFVLVFVALFIAGLALSEMASQGQMNLVPAQGRSSDLRERVMEKGDKEKRIAVVSILGGIMGNNVRARERQMAGKVVEELRAAGADDTVSAVLLQVHSPGGTITASDLIHREVLRLREAGKPVVAFVGGLAASGGYWVIAPADAIVCNPTGKVGSFGVVIYRLQVSELMDKIGIRPDTIKSTKHKDLGSPFRDLTEEEREYFQESLQHWHERFVEVIATGRGLDASEVRPLANGMLYNAETAMRHKLIDAKGYFEDALAEAKKRAGVDDPQVFHYYRHTSPLKRLLQMQARQTALTPKAIADEILERQGTVRIEARWRPGQ